MQNEEGVNTELFDQSGKARHKVYTQFGRPPDSGPINRRSIRARVSDGETFAPDSEVHSSGPTQRDNEGGSGSRGMRSSYSEVQNESVFTCLHCGAPVDDGGTFVARSEGHSFGPSQRDNEGGSRSRGTRSSSQDNGGGSGPRGPPTPSNREENNWLSQFLANPRNLFLVFLLAFMFMFFLFLFLFLCLFVFLFHVK